jgi:hypothetical protein
MSFSLTKKAVLVAIGLLAATSLTARADEPSAAALSLASTVIADIGLKASVDSFVPSLFNEMERNISGLHPEMQSSLHETLVALLPEYTKTEDSVLADVAHVLASKMTEQDLRDTQTFFESPVGKKYIATQSVLLQELSISAAVWRRQVSADLLTRVREEMKKKGYNF